MLEWTITEPAHLLDACRISLCQGGAFLVGRIAPNGPILQQRNVSYIHKATWGMHAAGVDSDLIARLLDWVGREALRENGDFYFPEEGPEYKDYQRVYRPLTFGKVAAWIGHPLIRQAKVLDRILQYQHAESGGCFHFIGDDPKRIEPPATIGVLNTTFFGQLMIALDMREPAQRAAEWVLRWTEANRQSLAYGELFTQMTPDGELVTKIADGARISHVVDTRQPRQEFWQVGTAIAYLCLMYDVMQTKWGASEEQARPYLDAALALLDFESQMPLDTYLWPSKCKVGWGAGELLRVLIRYRNQDPKSIEQAYRIAERVAVFTFLDNQLPDGGWSCMHYPLRDDIPALQWSYKPLKNTIRVPDRRIEESQCGKTATQRSATAPESQSISLVARSLAEKTPSSPFAVQTIFLPREEITGEFLGELQAIERGVAALYKGRDAQKT